MNKLLKSLLLVATLTISAVANAASFTFTGNLVNTNDVVTINFSLASAATDVRVWTDSYNGGANFDPIVAVFNASTGAKLAENDDNMLVAPGQTVFDSGIVFGTLAAGDYVFSMARFANFSNGNNFADGFNLDGTADEPISGGTFYRLNLSGVDTASVVTTPIPAAAWLFGSALLGVFGMRKRKSA